MAAIMIKGKITNGKTDYASSSLTGAETIAASVAANEVALIIDTGVRLDSIAINNLAKNLADAFREKKYVP